MKHAWYLFVFLPFYIQGQIFSDKSFANKQLKEVNVYYLQYEQKTLTEHYTFDTLGNEISLYQCDNGIHHRLTNNIIENGIPKAIYTQSYISKQNNALLKAYDEKFQIIMQSFGNNDAVFNKEIEKLDDEYQKLYEKNTETDIPWKRTEELMPDKLILFESNASVYYTFKEIKPGQYYLYCQQKNLKTTAGLDSITLFTFYEPEFIISHPYNFNLKAININELAAESTRKINYSHYTDSLVLNYFSDDVYMGKQIEQTDENSSIKSIVTLDFTNDTLSIYHEYLNADNRVWKKQRIVDKGRDVFDEEIYLEPFDEYHYKYNVQGLKIKVSCYSAGYLARTDIYEYSFW